jgi:predicted ABC-type ATPase
VLSAPDKPDFIRRAKEADYFVRLFFVGTDSPTINASRIARRVMESGHDVPIAKIISRYSKSIANCALAARIADRTTIYDNSVDYADPQLLFRVTDGKLGNKYRRINNWADEILKILQLKSSYHHRSERFHHDLSRVEPRESNSTQFKLL